MLKFRSGDLFESGAVAIINAVNCVGVMGKGLALQVKQAYPEVFKKYSEDCKKGLVKLGQVHVVDRHATDAPLMVINSPTKGHWRARSRYEDIRTGLKSLKSVIMELNIESVAIPPLGCGLGGLDWVKVRKLIEEELSDLEDVEIQVYTP